MLSIIRFLKVKVDIYIYTHLLISCLSMVLNSSFEYHTQPTRSSLRFLAVDIKPVLSHLAYRNIKIVVNLGSLVGISQQRELLKVLNYESPVSYKYDLKHKLTSPHDRKVLIKQKPGYSTF